MLKRTIYYCEQGDAVERFIETSEPDFEVSFIEHDGVIYRTLEDVGDNDPVLSTERLAQAGIVVHMVEDVPED